jgi:hypothetical protein
VTTVTHVLVTALGVQALGLHGSEAALAYAFGVGVDIDHAFKAPCYLRAVGWKRQLGYYWRSSLQEPVALLWVAPLSWMLGTVVPIVFLTAHIALDYSVSFEKMPLYPYSPWVTRGWLVRVPDKVKEIVVFTVFACSNLFLYLARR